MALCSIVLFVTSLLQTPAAASQAAQREATAVIDWKDAVRHIGEQVRVQGRIVATRNTGSICFLNFDSPESRAFTAIIRKDHFGRFNGTPETQYRDKWVRIFGRITEYRGKPQIQIVGPDQIEVLAGPAPLPPPASRPPAASGPASAPAPHEGVKIGACNVLNLFDEHDDPYTTDESTPAKPRAELEHLAASIRALDADVLAMEEVENRGCLEHFVKAMLDDMGYREVVQFEGNDTRGIDVAVLSRFPVGPVTSHRHVHFNDADGKPATFRRDLLEVRIEPPDKPPFEVFVVHLKSNRQDPAANTLRLGEARAARRIFDEKLKSDPDARFVVCGDFNDLWTSDSLKAIAGSGAGALRCFADDLPEPARISYNKAPYRSMIDFLLCSPAMAKRYIEKTYEIVPGTVESTGSDHNPIAARFRM